ncbi:MAG: nitroreductase family protein [Terriglobia bacterium]
MDLAENKQVNKYPLLDIIARRWSPRQFSSRPVEPEKLLTLFQAARWAPSSFNQQPWSFILARREDAANYARLLSVLAEKNAEWARTAPVLALSVAQRDFDRTGRPNRHAWHDVGQAVAYLTLQATALGLSVHQMAGFDAARAREVLAIPEGYEPVAAIALGYVDDPTRPPERTRRPTSEFVFEGEWGKRIDD